MTVKYSNRTGLMIVADKGADVYEQMKSRDRYADFMLNPSILRITNDPTDTIAISNGSCLIGNNGTGVFSGKSGHIAIYHDTENGNSTAGWETYTPFEGMEIVCPCLSGQGDFNGSPVSATLTWKFTLGSWSPEFSRSIVVSGIYDDPSIAVSDNPFAIYIVGSSPTGVFTGHSGEVAFKDPNVDEWRFVRLGEGQEAYVINGTGFTNYILLNDGDSVWLDKTKLLFSQYRDFFKTRFNRTRASLFNNSSAPYTAWDMFQLPSNDPYFKNLPSYPVRYISLDSDQELRLQEPVTEDSDGISGDLASNSFYEVHLFIKLNGYNLNTNAHGQVWMTGNPVLDAAGWNYIRAVWVDLPDFTGWRYYQIKQFSGGSGSGPTTASELPFVPFDSMTANETQSAVEQTWQKIKTPKIDVAVEVVSVASISGTYNYAINSGAVARLTLSANATIGLTAPTGLVAGTAVCVTMFVNPVTFTASWAADIDWGDAGAPTLTASKWNRLVFSKVYGDAKWQASVAGTGFSL